MIKIITKPTKAIHRFGEINCCKTQTYYKKDKA